MDIFNLELRLFLRIMVKYLFKIGNTETTTPDEHFLYNSLPMSFDNIALVIQNIFAESDLFINKWKSLFNNNCCI